MRTLLWGWNSSLAGPVVLVPGMDDETTTYYGKDISGSPTWLDVWAPQGNDWVLVA